MAVPVTESIDPSRPLLFSPFKVRSLTLKNRLVVPPMVHYRAGPGSTCGMFHNVHLGRYALGGFGLVFVEATAVEEVGLTPTGIVKRQTQAPNSKRRSPSLRGR